MSAWSDIVVPGMAAVGAALGIINSWNTLRDRRLKLKVTPKWAIVPDWQGLSIEVINRSTFPVTIAEVGFTIGRSRGPLPKRVRVPPESVINGPYPPVRLEPREAFSVTFDAGELRSHGIADAYAITASDETVRGTSEALQQFIREGVRR